MSILCSIHQLSLIFPEKTCFEPFDASIYQGQKIALIGDNGCGKSSLLAMIANKRPLQDGEICFHQQINIGYVPQTPQSVAGLSGGERFQKGLSDALALQPELLILDEPTNHLDTNNRHQLLQFLQYYPGTLLIASHDVQLLSLLPDTIWSFNQGKVELFDGLYDDFRREKDIEFMQLNQQLSSLQKDKQMAHANLMREQKRAKNAKEKGKKSISNRKWPTIVSHAKMHRAGLTAGRKKKQIHDKRENILTQIQDLGHHDIIEPKFHLPSGYISQKSVLMIRDGSVGYANATIVSQINLQLSGQGRLAITGVNGCGKSTLVKAILSFAEVARAGEWTMPCQKDIGYLDQHYQQLADYETVLSCIETARPDWPHQQVRSHLNDFLFKSNQSVNKSITDLSGGEKARLSLAMIAANPPKLLILDEMTNNLDITHRQYAIQCLQNYPGPMIVISHDEDFLNCIRISDVYSL